jgi:para-nitrobenzyl esterase
MRKIYFIALCLSILVVYRADAQCAGGRYQNEIFSGYTLDSVVYSTPYNLKVDIYQPAGDTLSARPLIILAHGGSFVSGTREDDNTIDSLCTRFARRGYVTASIDYRLTDYTSLILDSTLAISEVIKAISDGKAAVRYFVKDAATTNIYKIDTNNIFIGGNSAGAVLYMHVGYLDSLGECPSDIMDTMLANGGFEGNSGNAGYTTKSRAIIDLAGGLNHSSFVGPGDKPSVNAQGNNDNIVPYTCAFALNGLVKVTLCGLGTLEPVFDSNGIYHMSHVFPGDGHVPWSTDPVKFNTVDSLVNVFLYSLVCSGVTSVNEVAANTGLTLFPNPASEAVYLKSPVPVSDIVMYDATGRSVLQQDNINRGDYELNTARLYKGVYFVRIRFSDPNNAPLVKRIVVE